MRRSRRKNVFLPEYEKECRGIEKGRQSNYSAYCVPCGQEINLNSLSTGKYSIRIHQCEATHQQNLRFADLCQRISNVSANISVAIGLDLQVNAEKRYYIFDLKY